MFQVVQVLKGRRTGLNQSAEKMLFMYQPLWNPVYLFNKYHQSLPFWFSIVRLNDICDFKILGTLCSHRLKWNNLSTHLIEINTLLGLSSRPLCPVVHWFMISANMLLKGTELSWLCSAWIERLFKTCDYNTVCLEET